MRSGMPGLMIKANTKGLVVQASEYGIQAARVSRLGQPFHVEALDECGLPENPDEARQFMQDMVGSTKGQMSFAICGVYPPKRLVRRATLENASKARDPAFLPEYLKNQFKIDLGVYNISALSALDGRTFSTERGLTKELVFIGAPKAELLKEQERLVNFGLYPERMEIGTLATLGGIIHHCKLQHINGPILILEVSEGSSQVLIINDGQLDVARPIPHGLNSMYPVVQKELGLKDEESARKLFTSNTFDFTEMGSTLLSKLMKELQASTGFYEVQTGQTIGHIFLPLLPDNLAWIGAVLARTLGVDEIKASLSEWANSQGITVEETVDLSGKGARWMSLFSLMGNYQAATEQTAEAKGGVDGSKTK